MQRGDLVYVGHMLDMSRKATEKVQGLMNVDEDVVWEVVTRDLPALVAALEKVTVLGSGSSNGVDTTRFAPRDAPSRLSSPNLNRTAAARRIRSPGTGSA